MIVLIYGSLHPAVMTRCPMFWSRAFFLSNITRMMWLLPIGSGPPHVFLFGKEDTKLSLIWNMQSLIPTCIPSFLPSTWVKFEVYDGLKNGNMKTVEKYGFAENAGGIHWFQVYPVEWKWWVEVACSKDEQQFIALCLPSLICHTWSRTLFRFDRAIYFAADLKICNTSLIHFVGYPQHCALPYKAIILMIWVYSIHV